VSFGNGWHAMSGLARRSSWRDAKNIRIGDPVIRGMILSLDCPLVSRLREAHKLDSAVIIWYLIVNGYHVIMGNLMMSHATQ